ncbi:DUF3408 domain-containing protein [Prevotella denticola]|uniref:Protein of uncharacterized function (DUF3408) n=1 Tax=Prevotella denticola TaxID=28129 RepID=A0A379EDP9_9BACT|nr:DUF3408 domain-containing protein [Prevotella denticola]SUB94519.1 Protein of uncharacterised function (DUF3408) [Prevotella denticola]
MKKKTNTTEKDFSWLLGVEDEADDKSTSKAETIVQEKERQSNVQKQKYDSPQSVLEVTSEISGPSQHTENTPIQKRISAKMRKKTLGAYKQAYLMPTKLSNRKAVYLSRETQERTDFIVRRLGDRGSNLSSFVENIVHLHLEEYGEDIEKWRRL